MKLGVNK